MIDLINMLFIILALWWLQASVRYILLFRYITQRQQEFQRAQHPNNPALAAIYREIDEECGIVDPDLKTVSFAPVVEVPCDTGPMRQIVRHYYTGEASVNFMIGVDHE